MWYFITFLLGLIVGAGLSIILMIVFADWAAEDVIRRKQ